MSIDEAEKIKTVVENKDYIAELVNIVVKTMIDAIEAFENLKIEDVDMFQLGYNKALYDFVNACKEDILCQTFGLRQCNIDKIAEQLKAGGENEQSI